MDRPCFKVIVPATTANLGAGLDCLGLALSLYNEIEIIPGEVGLSVYGEGQGDGSWRENLIWKTYQSFFDRLGEKPPKVRLACTNRIPFAQGLGSSAAARIGALVAANQWLGNPVSQIELLQMAAHDEGHPDNVAAALYGGLVICGGAGPGLTVKQIKPAPGIRIVLLIPQQPLKTEEARRVLPDSVPFHDAVANLQNTALTAAAFTTGDYSLLAHSLPDRLHQPYREQLVPGLSEIIHAARAAGAYGAALSGAGPAVAAFTKGHEDQVALAMAEAYLRVGRGSCRTQVLDVDLTGTQVSIS